MFLPRPRTAGASLGNVAEFADESNQEIERIGSPFPMRDSRGGDGIAWRIDSKTPTRRFAPTPDQVRGRLSPFQGEAEQAARSCHEAKAQHERLALPSP